MFREMTNYLLTGGHPYKRSTRRKVYEEIAERLDESPDKVYRIAHNPGFATIFDGAIVSELMERNILVRK
ncbi:MAG: hypothetical protein J6M19_00545 [Bacteroidaceae bacterium]|nr:hypothetical protein [Bacteroidaceae bacterium]